MTNPSLAAKVHSAYKRCSSPTERRNPDGTFTVDGPSYIAMRELIQLAPEIVAWLTQA